MASAAATTENIDIFISYNWDTQNTVRHIYNGLKSEGFRCWMDERKMGGGDEMYREIARGVTNCQLLIACVTKQYIKSLNCCQEMKLAYDLKTKIIIPVLIENIKWPIDDELGYIFAGRIYINMSDSLRELERWKGPKVDELVNNIRKHLSAKAPPSLKKEEAVPRSIQEQAPEIVAPVPENGAKLAMMFRSFNFSTSQPVAQHRVEQECYSCIKLDFPGLQPGWRSFKEVRDLVSPFIKCGWLTWLVFGEIKCIQQYRGNVEGRAVAEVTSRVTDEVEEREELKEFCCDTGRMLSWEEARMKWPRKDIYDGGKVLICGGGRRTVLVVYPR